MVAVQIYLTRVQTNAGANMETKEQLAQRLNDRGEFLRRTSHFGALDTPEDVAAWRLHWAENNDPKDALDFVVARQVPVRGCPPPYWGDGAWFWVDVCRILTACL